MTARSFYGTVDTFLDDWYLNSDTPATGAVQAALQAASDMIDKMLVNSIYATDDEGIATDTDLATAIEEATYIQARYLMDLPGGVVGAERQVASYSAGGISVTYQALQDRNGNSTLTRVSEDAKNRLFRDGILSSSPGWANQNPLLITWWRSL